jgi:hypothetical protein
MAPLDGPVEAPLDFLKKRLHAQVLGRHYIRYARKYIFKPPLVGEIVELFRRHFAPKLGELIQPCFITDTTDIEHPVTVFNRELFLATVPAADAAFYDAFLGTTAFHEFSDGRMEEKTQTLSRSSFSSSCLSAFAESTFDPDGMASTGSYGCLSQEGE